MRVVPAIALMALLVLLMPTSSRADHLRPSATLSARVAEQSAPQVWLVEITWNAGCQGAAADATYFDGHIHLIDLDTGERIYVGGIVLASGEKRVTFAAKERAQRFQPELTTNCYESFPLHGSTTITVTGNPVVVPARFAGRTGPGGGAGGGGSGGGSGEGPTTALGSGGCLAALLGTNGRDALTGSDGGEVIIGFGGDDRLRGAGGHDCVIGGEGADRLHGQDGADRLTGGRGRDVLIGGPGLNAYDAGPGDDRIDARNGVRELVRCGPGRDRVRADRRDRVRGCEIVSRPA